MSNSVRYLQYQCSNSAGHCLQSHQEEIPNRFQSLRRRRCADVVCAAQLWWISRHSSFHPWKLRIISLQVRLCPPTSICRYRNHARPRHSTLLRQKVVYQSLVDQRWRYHLPQARSTVRHAEKTSPSTTTTTTTNPNNHSLPPQSTVLHLKTTTDQCRTPSPRSTSSEKQQSSPSPATAPPSSSTAKP